MLMKICSRCGKKYQAGTRCTCKSAAEAQRQKEYDRTKRSKDRAGFYNSPGWERVRMAVKSRANGLDEYVWRTEHRLAPGTLAHHIRTLAEEPDRALDVGNLIWVSTDTHAYIHKVYDRGSADKAKLQRELASIAQGGGH